MCCQIMLILLDTSIVVLCQIKLHQIMCDEYLSDVSLCTVAASTTLAIIAAIVLPVIVIIVALCLLIYKQKKDKLLKCR